MKSLLKLFNESADINDINNPEKIKFYYEFLTQSDDSNEKNYDTDVDELMNVYLLQHSKNHIMNNTSEKNQTLEKIFNKIYNKTVCNVPLYRGLLHETINLFKNKTYIFNRYQSFSEEIAIAKNFCNKNTKLILKINPPIYNGFPLYKVKIDSLNLLKIKEPKVFKDNDCEYAINSLNKEKEWIFNINTKLEIIDTYTDEEYTIVEATQLKN